MRLARCILVLLLSSLFISSCVSLDSVSVTQIPVNRSQKVNAEAERFIFLGFNFDNDYVNSITSDLKNQCTNGTVSGILTKTESTMYFLFFFWKKRVSATGYCIPSKVASGVESRKRRPTTSSEEDATAPEYLEEPTTL